jgi:hypothetical protein
VHFNNFSNANKLAISIGKCEKYYIFFRHFHDHYRKMNILNWVNFYYQNCLAIAIKIEFVAHTKNISRKFIHSVNYSNLFKFKAVQKWKIVWKISFYKKSFRLKNWNWKKIESRNDNIKNFYWNFRVLFKRLFNPFESNDKYWQ